MPSVSVIIPVFNAASWLRECLDSLLAQTLRGWEAICIDDGSTDAGGAILAQYAAKDARIRVVSQENRGVSAARNRAIDAARGEWLAFLDADDTIERDWLERMAGHADSNTDIVHADSEYCFGGRFVRSRLRSTPVETFLRDGWSQLNLLRRSFAAGTRYPEGMRLKEDVVFFAALALKGARVRIVFERGYNYRRHEGSAIAALIPETDCLRFAEELSRLPLSRIDFARAVGYDLVLWVKGRDWSKPFVPAQSRLLAFWRDAVASGRLRIGDVRWWWRPALRRWLASGDLAPFRRTLVLRIAVGEWLAKLRLR